MLFSKLPATFALFPVLSRGYAHAQLSSFYLLSTFGAFHVTKNTRLSTPAQLQCSRSGAWEPGNEANQNMFVPYFQTPPAASALEDLVQDQRLYGETQLFLQ